MGTSSAVKFRANRDTIEVTRTVTDARMAVFDSHWILRSCCESFATGLGASPESLVGVHLDAIVGADAGADRRDLCRPAMERGERVQYATICAGRRSIVTVFPLDSSAFGHEGVLTVVCPASSPEEGRGLPVARVPALGNGLGKLSKAELCVAYLFATGLTVAQIGERLSRSEHTVNDHIKAIHRKLNVSRQVELATFLAHAGIAGFTESEWCLLTHANMPNPSTSCEVKAPTTAQKRVAHVVAASLAAPAGVIPCGDGPSHRLSH